MRWPSWTKNLRLRPRRRSASPTDRAPFLPRIYRLEDRRVLDVSAAFSSATGQLELLLTSAAETAAISVSNGNITITDSQQQNVEIDVDGSDPAPVNASAVDSISVVGDAAAGQGLVLESPLALPKGLFVGASIERAEIKADLTRVDQGPIRVAASAVLLGADVITSGQDVSFDGAVQLTDSVRIVGRNVNFSSSIDDDGATATPAALLVEADGLTRFGGAIGAISAVTRLETDALGRTELNGNITANGNTVMFADAVTLTNHLTITDNGPNGIIFGSTVDSAANGFFGLRLAAPDGQIKFNNDIGAGSSGDQRLGSLIVEEAADGVIFGDLGTVSEVDVAGPVDLGAGSHVIGGAGIVLNGGIQGLNIRTDGFVRFNGATALQTDVSIATVKGGITFTSDATIDSQVNLTNSLTLDAQAGAIFFNADIGSTLPLRGLTVTRADAGVTFGASDTRTVGGAGPVSLVSSFDPITIGVGANAVAGGIIFNAGNGNTLVITTTNDDVNLNGPVALNSSVSISTGPGPGDIRFLGAVDSQTGESNDFTLNAGTGSISFSKLVGADSPVGDFSIIQADGGVTFTTLGNAGPVPGIAPVLTATKTIDIGVAANEIAGTGIRFDGGRLVSAVMESLTGGIRLNGNVVLGTNLRILSGGDVTFTNDSPIDSVSGEAFSLAINSPTGGVFFNEDIGFSGPLDQLSIGVARDGVFLGQATNEIPGTGGLGPVELVRLEGALDIGSGTNVIGGAGIVLSGSAIAPLQISTTDDSVRFNGAVTLQTDVMIDTGSTGADIIFTNATSIDSGTVRHGSLILDAGAGRIEFNEDIGAIRAIGSLIITEADGGVVFGRADSESNARDALGPVNTIQADGPIDIGVGTDVIGGAGIVFNGGSDALSITTTDDSIRLNGPVKLQSDLIISTGSGAGDVTFTSAATIDSHDGPGAITTVEHNDLVIDAGDGGMSFNASIGVTQSIGRLIVDRAARGIVFGGADTATVGGTGPVTQVLTDGEIDLGTGDTADDLLGPVVFNAGANEFLVLTTGDNIRINGPVLLQSDLALVTGPGSGDLTFTDGSSIDGQVGEVRTLQITLDEGDARFGGAIGAITRLGDFTLHSVHNADFDGPVFASRIVQESGSGETSFHASVNTNHATEAGLALDGTSFSFDGPVLATGDGRVSINHQGTVDIHPGADFRIDGTFHEEGNGSPVRIAANLATSGDVIDFESPVIVGSGATQILLSTVAGGQPTGADIHFRSTLNGETAGSQNVLLNAGTAGDISFDLTVGAAARLGVLTIVQAENLRFNSHLIAARVLQLNGQNSSFAGRVDLNHPTLPAIEMKSVNVGFLGPVTTTGNGAVLLDVSGLLSLTEQADMNLNGPFQQIGSGESFVRGDITTTDDDIHFAGPFVVNGDVRLDTGSGPGSIQFDSVVDIRLGVPHDLTLNSGTGDIVFTGPIGQATPIDHLRIESARDVMLGAGARLTSFVQNSGVGTTTINGVVLSTGPEGVQLTTNNIVANESIDTRGGVGGPITLIAANDIDVRSSLLTDGKVIALTAGDDVTFGSLGLARSGSSGITITADSDQTAGGQILMADGALIDSGVALLQLAATDNITIGRLVSTSQVNVTSTAGAILDAGDANGADIVAPRARLQAGAGIGLDAVGSGKDARPANPLETEVSILAAANTTTGGIHIVNRDVGTLTLGDVDGLVGLDNGGSGAIEISNLGTLLVNGAVLNHGGGDTRLRAEIPGDLVVNRPVQNSGGNGSIFLFSGGDLIIHDSLPEPPGKIENPPNPEQFFEIMVTGEGAVRGEARHDVLLDDGEENYVIVRTATGQITNVPPILSIRTIDQGGSDIDEQGIGFVEVKVGDGIHLETNFHIQIDWGDGEIESFPIPGTIHPQRQPGNTDPRFDGGQIGPLGVREPGTYIFMHKYFAHPNPDDPSAPIPIRVELRMDARASGESSIDANRPVDDSAIFNGIRFVNNVANVIFTTQDDTFSVPGTGNFSFVKVVESVIVPVEIRTVAVPPPPETAVSFASSAGLRTEFKVKTFESQDQEEYRLFMVVVDDVTAKEGEERIELSLELLGDPLSLFRTRRFPNGHYRIYLEEVRTHRIRLILDVHIFDGKVVPPNFREGAGEKQPGADQRPAPMNPGPQPNANGALPANSQPMTLAFEDALPNGEHVSAELTSSDGIFQLEPPRSMSRIARFVRRLRSQ